MKQLQGTLTSVFKMESSRGKQIGAGFTPICFQFDQFIELSDDKKEDSFSVIISTMKKMGRLSDAVSPMPLYTH